jgi:hypothetical protein
MSCKPVTPADLAELADERVAGINLLLQKYYISHLGYVELTWESVAAALTLHSSTPVREAVLQQVADTYSKAGWTVTWKQEPFVIDGERPLIVRFKANK